MVNITNKDIWYTVGLSAIFVCGFLLTSLLYYSLLKPLRRRKRIRQRMKMAHNADMLQGQVFKRMDEESSLIVALLEKIGARQLLDDLQRLLLQADIYWSVAVFLGVASILAVVGYFLGWLWDGSLRGILIGSMMVLLPFVYLWFRKRHKSNLAEKQLPDVMELLARSLRAGHTLPSSIELTGRETPHPLGTELRMAYEEQRLGISMAEALRHMCTRVDSPDLRYFVTAVLVQSQSGGNLAQIMENIALLVRDRLRVKGKIRGLTAEGRLSAIILGILPFFIFSILYFLRKDYVMILFTDPLGKKLMVAGIISLIIGILTMKKMIQVRV
jgi:tight adherence protein B